MTGFTTKLDIYEYQKPQLTLILKTIKKREGTRITKYNFDI